MSKRPGMVIVAIGVLDKASLSRERNLGRR